jgi:hypothetical protein
MTTADGSDGTLTSEIFRSSHAENKSPRSLLRGSASIGRKPTLTALKTPALARAQNSSATRDAPGGAKVMRASIAAGLRVRAAVPTGAFGLWLASTIGFDL